MVSNDPNQIQKFIANNLRTIYKPFKPHAWENHAHDSIFHTATTLFDPTTKLEDDVLSICPGIYQAYIEKSCDLRVTVIGDRFFTVQIGSRTKQGFVDWRPHWRDDDFCCTPVKLPAAYEEKLRALMKRLNIIYGAIDLAVDREGELYFLEVNQIGQFLFVESWVESLPLLQAMCAMLAEGRTDYSLSTCPDVRYQDCLTSDEYQQLKETALKGASDDTSGISQEGQSAGPDNSELSAAGTQFVHRTDSKCSKCDI